MRTSTYTYAEWQPEQTPPTIIRIIVATVILSLVSGLFDGFLYNLFTTNLGTFFTLSWSGIYHFHIWQPLTYAFIDINFSDNTITFWSLLSLAFQMYLLWICGSSICRQVGEKAFLYFYIISAAICGIIALLTIPLWNPYATINGPSGALFAVFTVWTFFNPNLELLLFFVVAIKAKWLLALITGALILVNISQGDMTTLAWYCSAIFIGYLWCLLAWDLSSPYTQLWGFDKRINRIAAFVKNKIKNYRTKKKQGSESNSKTKIFDIQTGEAVIDDDQFVDAMLTKIYKYGEASLSWPERKRLDAISNRKVEEQKKKQD